MEQAVTHVPDFLPALPEILMAAGAMALLMWGVFRKCDARETGIGAIGLLVLVGALLVIEPNAAVQTFGGMFVVDGFTKFMKLLILLAAIAAIVPPSHPRTTYSVLIPHCCDLGPSPRAGGALLLFSAPGPQSCPRS